MTGKYKLLLRDRPPININLIVIFDTNSKNCIFSLMTLKICQKIQSYVLNF